MILFANETTQSTLKKAKSTLPQHCFFYFEMFLHAKAPKAFAYAIDSKESVTCRFSSSSKNQDRANEVALASCKKSAKKRKITAPCKLYHISHSLSKTKRQLQFEEKYLINYKKVKNNITNLKVKTTATIPKPCTMFYKLYQEAKPHKAFAIAIESDKKYTCRYSAGSKTEKKAKEVALASCEKMRKKRAIKAPCLLFKERKSETKIEKKEEAKKIVPTPKLSPKKKKKEAKREEHKTSSPALIKAILAANLQEIKALIKKGADINTQAPDHSRALFVAVAQGDIAYTKELLKKGAFVFIKKRDGNNLLVAAIISGNNRLLRLMLEQKIDPNIRCEDGNTPLHFAFMMFDDKMMRTLYAFGARDDIENDKGKTVKALAKEFHIDLKRLRR